MPDPVVHLGLVLRLDIQPDTQGSPPEPLLRDRLACEVLRTLRRLPAGIDLEGVRHVAREVLSRYAQVAAQVAAQVRGTTLDDGSVVDMDLAAIAVSLLGPAWSAEGYSLFGYRWRLVDRQRVDVADFEREAAAADFRLGSWLKSVGGCAG